jgi:hypothetical protein
VKTHVLVFLTLNSLLAYPAERVLEPGQEAAAKESFRRLLTEIKPTQVVTLWFTNENATCGMLMYLNFDPSRAMLEVSACSPGRGMTTEDRKMSRWQVEKLNKLLSEMPLSDAEAEYRWSVFVARWRAGKVEVLQYDRRRIPSAIERLFDLGGGCLEAAKIPPSSTDKKR